MRNIHCQPRYRQKARDGVAQRSRDEEPRDRPSTIASREPVRDVEQHARNEPGLRDAKQKAHHEEAHRPNDESGCARDQAPGDHDSRHPDPRAHTFHDQVARHFEGEVADEKDSRAPSVAERREADIPVHRERREANVHAIEEVDQEHHGHQRQQTHHDLAHRPLLDRGVGLGPRCGHVG
jgi:hypothetical protein